MAKYRIKVRAGKWRNSRGEESELSAREFIVEAENKTQARRKAHARMYGFQQGIDSISKVNPNTGR